MAHTRRVPYKETDYTDVGLDGFFLYLHMSEKQGIDASAINSVLNRQHIYDYASSEFNGCFLKYY